MSWLAMKSPLPLPLNASIFVATKATRRDSSPSALEIASTAASAELKRPSVLSALPLPSHALARAQPEARAR